MVARRSFFKIASLLSGSILLGSHSNKAKSTSIFLSLEMPEESQLHERTWMSFVANDYIWSDRQIPEVKRNLVLIAKTIAKYETVSILVSPDDYSEAVLLFGGSATHQFPIELVRFSSDDLWLRDTGPTFVKGSDGKKYGIDFNFNGWGGKQEHAQDAKVAGFIAKKANVVLQKANLVLEGGGFEIDGHGTAILAKSCVVNDNRNPGITLAEAEQELKALLGLRKIIWVEGIKDRDITDGHIDFYARFSKQGEVLVNRDNYQQSYDYEITRENINVLSKATDAEGNKLNVVIVDSPDSIDESYGVDDFAAGYIGYYVCNGAIIMQSFGDKKADQNARKLLSKAFPTRTVEQLQINGIASGGGSIHCATQQEPSI